MRRIFFFPSYNFISLPINLYLFLAGCLLVLSFIISKHVNKVVSSFIVFQCSLNKPQKFHIQQSILLFYNSLSLQVNWLSNFQLNY